MIVDPSTRDSLQSFFKQSIFTAVPLQAGGLDHFICFHSVGNVIIPTDELILFRGFGIPTTSTGLKYLKMCFFSDGRKKGHLDSLEKLRGLFDLCDALGVRVGPVQLESESGKVMRLGWRGE